MSFDDVKNATNSFRNGHNHDNHVTNVVQGHIYPKHGNAGQARAWATRHPSDRDLVSYFGSGYGSADKIVELIEACLTRVAHANVDKIKVYETKTSNSKYIISCKFTSEIGNEYYTSGIGSAYKHLTCIFDINRGVLTAYPDGEIPGTQDRGTQIFPSVNHIAEARLEAAARASLAAGGEGMGL